MLVSSKSHVFLPQIEYWYTLWTSTTVSNIVLILIEFAFEIGSGLLTEIRRLQSLLAERDKSLLDMKEEKDDMDRSLDSLRTALRTQEANAGTLCSLSSSPHVFS
jgi:hypothetical protein